MEKETQVKQLSDARRIVRYAISVAACILLVVVGVIGYNFYKLSPNGVFNEHYEPYNLSTEPGTPPATANNDTLILFLSGMSQLEKKNYSEAIPYYKKVIEANEKAGTRRFKDEAEFYLALAYICEKDFDLALELLHKIHDDPHHLYQEKVTRKLLRQVKWLKWR